MPPQADGAPVVVYRADAAGSWRALSTDQIGQDMFRAPLTHPGDYALVAAAPGPAGIVTGPTGPTGGPDRSTVGTGGTHLVLLLAAAVAVMALVLLGLRIRTIRTQANPRR